MHALEIFTGTILVKVEGGVPGTAPSSPTLLPEGEGSCALGILDSGFWIEQEKMMVMAKVKAEEEHTRGRQGEWEMGRRMKAEIKSEDRERIQDSGFGIRD